MRNKFFLFGMMLAFLSIIGCSSSRVLVDNPALKELLGGHRTAGAASAVLGSYGTKNYTGKNIFVRFGMPEWQDVEIYVALGANVTEKDSAALAKFGISIGSIIRAQTDGGKKQRESYQIIYLQIADLSRLRDEIRKKMKSDPDFLKDISRSRARIITTVGMVFNYQLQKEIEALFDLKAKLVKFGIEFTGGSGNKFTIQLADKTIVAYQFSRFCWEPDGTLSTFSLDRDGRDRCPDGTSDSRKVRVTQ